jgi:hypothetical protein
MERGRFSGFMLAAGVVAAVLSPLILIVEGVAC